MRYKKGSRVEILSREAVPLGSWRCAEILFGNGHTYTVRYDVHRDFTNEAIVERVSRKLIRPCPPAVDLKDDWAPGEVLEVFHNLSWKMATVSKVLGRNFFVVRLVGSSQELKVQKFNLRVRQCWHDDEWTVIRKCSGSYEDWKQNERLNLKHIREPGCRAKQTNARMNFHVKDHYFEARDNFYLQESHNVSSRTLKRGSPYWHSQAEVLEGRAQKFIAAEKEGRSHRVAASISPAKVEAVVSTRETVGEKHMHASFNNRTTHFLKMDVEREKPNGDYGCSHAISLEPIDADNITSSVGSCSITSNSPYSFPCHSGSFEENESHSSNAESFCRSGCEKEVSAPPTKEDLAEEIHRLELHAYRCTLQALHASGPLSWEQETLVTDLRISLHISNDEYLMELRNLVSNATSIPFT